MKKVLAIVAACLLIHSYANPAAAFADGETPPPATIEPVAPSPADAAAMKAAMDRLDASAAEVNKFLAQQDADANPRIDPLFGARMPRLCPAATSPPTAAQAAVLVQCTMDFETPQQAKLHQDVTIRLGSSHKPGNKDLWPSLDVRYPVLDIAGSATVYVCAPVFEATLHNTGTNCDRYQYQNAPGVCWRTLDGNYQCQLNAPFTGVVRKQPPPIAF